MSQKYHMKHHEKGVLLVFASGFTFIAIEGNDADGPTSLFKFKGCLIDLTIFMKTIVSQ